MSDKNGYCLAYRRAWTHDAFNDLLEAAIWNFLYQNAFYEDGDRTFNGVVYHLKRGQIATTPRFLAKGFRITESNARRVIQKLIKLKSIETQTTTKATIITICNYDKYQLSIKTNDDQSDNQTENKRKTNDANNNKGTKEAINENNISDFESFWLAYPINKRTKGSKKEAQLKFNVALKKNSFKNIMQGVKDYENYIRSTGQSNQDAFRWLEKERWRDEYHVQQYEQPTARPEQYTASEAIARGLGLE